jgi:hypothetical protein
MRYSKYQGPSSLNLLKMFLKHLKTNENISYKNSYLGASNSAKSLKTFVEGKRMKLK